MCCYQNPRATLLFFFSEILTEHGVIIIMVIGYVVSEKWKYLDSKVHGAHMGPIWGR